MLQPELHVNEGKLFDRCDLVFTGGVSLYEAKRERHPRVYAFPSSVDSTHFAKARLRSDLAADQKDLPKPRLGYAGVIDERVDLELIREVARRRPEWQIVMIGPVLKVDPASLPRHANIHWLGMKQYTELPEYFSGWDIATMPFALNESTLFISPTKTPEYLAAGLPVISTAIRDVVRTYGSQGMATIVDDASEFITAADSILDKGLSGGKDLKLRQKADEYIGTLSWNKTWSAMNALIQEVISSKAIRLRISPCSNQAPPLRMVWHRMVLRRMVTRAWWSRKQGLDGSLAGKSSTDVLAQTGWARCVGGAAPYLTLFARCGRHVK